MEPGIVSRGPQAAFRHSFGLGKADGWQWIYRLLFKDMLKGKRYGHLFRLYSHSPTGLVSESHSSVITNRPRWTRKIGATMSIFWVAWASHHVQSGLWNPKTGTENKTSDCSPQTQHGTEKTWTVGSQPANNVRTYLFHQSQFLRNDRTTSDLCFKRCCIRKERCNFSKFLRVMKSRFSIWASRGGYGVHT